MTVSETIIFGVISGVVTSAVVSILIVYVNKVMIPWYRRLIYKGRDISGEWRSISKKVGLTESASIIITQKENNLNGIIKITKLSENGEIVETKTYKVTGEYNDRIVRLSGENVNKKQIGVAVMLLEVVDGGKKMKGVEAWYSTTCNKVSHQETEWELQNA